MVHALVGSILAALAVSSADAAPSPSVSATVLATASRRGVLARDGSFKVPVGGMARLATVVARERAGGRAVFWVDAGNFGAAENNPFEPWERTTFMWDMMADLKVDVVTPGDLEMLEGVQALKDLYTRHPEIQVVSANVADKSGNLLFPKFTVIERDGIRFGVTGVTGEAYYNFNITRKRQLKDDFSFKDSMAALKEVVPELRKQCDILVALIHEGPGDVSKVLNEVSGVDVAVVGHNSGSPVTEERVGGALFLRTGNQGRGVAAADRDAGGDGTLKARWIRMDDRVPDEPAVDARVQAFLKRETDRQGRASVGIQLRECRELPCREPGSWTLDPWHHDGDPVAGTVRDRTKGELRFRWAGTLGRDTRPLAERVARPRPLPSLTYAMISAGGDTSRGEAAPGSRLEREFAMLFRTLSRIDLPEDDAVRYLGALEIPEGTSALDGLSPEARRGVILFALAERLESPGGEGALRAYWNRRALVYFELLADAAGDVQQATLLENNASPSSVDSVRQTLLGWTVPVPSPDWPPDRPVRVVTAVALDRRETRLREALRARYPAGGRLASAPLPASVRPAFEGDHAAAWVNAWHQVDPKFGLEDFLATETDTLAAFTRVPLEGPLASRKRQLLRVVALSPGGEWRLDLFAGTPVRPGRRMHPERACLELTGTRGARSPFWIPVPGATFTLGRWVDAETFVILGTSPIDHPRFPKGAWGQVRVPTVWVGDTHAGTLRTYRGAPVPPTALARAENLLAAVQQAAYPQVHFER